jgi:hypothetical protein
MSGPERRRRYLMGALGSIAVLAFACGQRGDAIRPDPEAKLSASAASSIPEVGGLDGGTQAALRARLISTWTNYHSDGLGLDCATGLTLDKRLIDPTTGKLVGSAYDYATAPAKESLHVILLIKSVQGNADAQAIVPANVALDLLTRKVTSYEAFDAAYPGFGGYLPWFLVQNGAAVPCPDWMGKVPSLDNGQLMWAEYYAAKALTALNQPALAQRYQARYQEMAANAVTIFYDAASKQMRAEAVLEKPNTVPVAQNGYKNGPYFLDGASEGLMFLHFADLFGTWPDQASKDGIWAVPRRKPGTVMRDGQPVTIEKTWWASAHEYWGEMFLPYSDVPISARLLKNAMRAMTWYSAQNNQPGLFASAHKPLSLTQVPLEYQSAYGVPDEANDPGTPPGPPNVVVPYAAFPVGLVDMPTFYAWAYNMLSAPRMFGPNGLGESMTADGTNFAAVLSFDANMLPLVAFLGGMASDVKADLQADGLLAAFDARVAHDFSAFDPNNIQGEGLSYALPQTAVPNGHCRFPSGKSVAHYGMQGAAASHV